MRQFRCYCGRKLPENSSNRTYYICKCGRWYLWKRRSNKWVYAGMLDEDDYDEFTEDDEW